MAVDASNQKPNSREESYRLMRQAALVLGVDPPSRWMHPFAKYSLRVHKWILPWLHLYSTYPPNSNLSLLCLWWRAIASSNPHSPMYDPHYLAYSLLPRPFRWTVLCWRLWPRFLHVHVELRGTYLQNSVRAIAHEFPEPSKTLIYLGAGYDVRSLLLCQQGLVDHAVELDLPHVIQAKRQMIQQLCQQHPCNAQSITLCPVNLNDLEKLHELLVELTKEDAHYVFMLEAVLLYLDEPKQVLQLCSRVLREQNKMGSLCFADDLPISSDDLANPELATMGWELNDWIPKGGRTRYLGRATLLAHGV